VSYFWCEEHKRVEQAGEDTPECLLVGPFSTKAQAETFNAAVALSPTSTRLKP
jgi:hypothetical protein